MSEKVKRLSGDEIAAIVRQDARRLSKPVAMLLWAWVGAGIIAFLHRVSGSDPALGWATFHVNAVFWFMLSITAPCFTAALQICRAEWARPFRRIFEAPLEFCLIALVPFVVMYLFGYSAIMPWAGHAVPGKELWLSPKFLFARDALCAGIMIYLAKRFVRKSLQIDFTAIRQGLCGADRSSRWFAPAYDSFNATSGIDESLAFRSRLSPVIVIVYSAAMSLFVYDQVMSVDPHWYSTLFGTFVFMSAVYLAMAWACLAAFWLTRSDAVYARLLKRTSLHDLGKLLFGFGIFWAYLFWSHYLTIWYANIPEETNWLIIRLRLEPWHGLGWLVLGCCFIYPFIFGLSRDVKYVPGLLAATSLVVAAGLWLQTYMLIVPTISPDVIPLGLADALITGGFGCAFFMCAARFLGRYPLVPVGDCCAS